MRLPNQSNPISRNSFNFSGLKDDISPRKTVPVIRSRPGSRPIPYQLIYIGSLESCQNKPVNSVLSCIKEITNSALKYCSSKSIGNDRTRCINDSRISCKNACTSREMPSSLKTDCKKICTF